LKPLVFLESFKGFLPPPKPARALPGSAGIPAGLSGSIETPATCPFTDGGDPGGHKGRPYMKRYSSIGL